MNEGARLRERELRNSHDGYSMGGGGGGAEIEKQGEKIEVGGAERLEIEIDDIENDGGAPLSPLW